MKKIICLFLALSLLLAGCGTANTKTDDQSFAEAHDAFETKLIKQESDNDAIPAPPEGVFDLVHYDTKAGKLAAYVSSDPQDGQKHPAVIWIVGGWGYGIDEYFWQYPEWDNDQTGSAFREAGLLMMYPSFRGANGNPGYYEAVFGEIDDIEAAYDYLASLPYIDPDRVYLAGHSTGGTKVLLASEYTDKFRAVFSFGPVDEIKYHNTTQFTFDTSNKEEYRLRSPIHWLDDIKSPTFIIEGEDGNASNLKTIESKSKNANIHCYVVDGADHFSVLAPTTRLLAQKILADTDAVSNITITQQELQDAMKQSPIEPLPIMLPYCDEVAGISLLVPVIWEPESDDAHMKLEFYSSYDDDNFWDMSIMYIDIYEVGADAPFEQFVQVYEEYDYQGKMVDVTGQDTYIAEGVVVNRSGYEFFNKVAIFKKNDRITQVDFYVPQEYKDAADPMFQTIIDSITLD